MVAIIHSSKNLRNALHHNENKVRQNVATFIHAGNYPKDMHLLGFSDKVNRLERLTELNQQTKINSVHISLNFDVSDKLNQDRLKEITDKYLKEIGFNEQPYLVYQHNDSGHPRIHIVQQILEGMEAGLLCTIWEEINLKRPGKKLNVNLD